MTELQTRKPTGAVPWPLILVEGGEKAGKSYACALLSASPRVGRVLWLDIGEGAADEYAAIKGARYEIIEHDGTWPSIMAQVDAAKEEASRAAAAGDPPVVLIIDSMTAAWNLLKDWASTRAKTTSANRKKLADDPSAEVTVTMNLWNDAGGRHRQLMTRLMTFPGIVAVTARGGEVALVENGKPVEGRKSYRVDGHKDLAYDATVWIRLSRDSKPTVVGARSVYTGIRPGVDDPQKLADDWSLDWVIFTALRCVPAKAHVRDLVEPKPEVLTPEQIRDQACDKATTFEQIRDLHAMAGDLGYRDVALVNEAGDEESLLDMLLRLGNERRGVTQPPRQPRQAAKAPPIPEPAGDPRRDDPFWDNEAWTIAVEEMSTFATDDEGRELWEAVIARRKAGLIHAAEDKRLKEVIKARWAALKAEAAEAEPVDGVIVSELDPSDPWALKVQEITDDDGAAELTEEVMRELAAGHMDDSKAAAIHGAIAARQSELTGQGALV